MQKIALFLACLACAGHSRRVQSSMSDISEKSTEQKPAESLATLLTKLNGKAAFAPTAGAGMRASAGKTSSPSMLIKPGEETNLQGVSHQLRRANPADPKDEFGSVNIKQPFATRTFEPEAEEFDVKKMAGITAPLGFFDPLGFTKDATKEKIFKYREAELKHGRVSMLACLGMIATQNFRPFFDGKGKANPLEAILVVPKLGWLQIFTFIGFCEVLGLYIAKTPGYQPGEWYGPANLAERQYQDKELNNGRLAMFGAIGMLVGAYLNPGVGVLEAPEKMNAILGAQR